MNTNFNNQRISVHQKQIHQFEVKAASQIVISNKENPINIRVESNHYSENLKFRTIDDQTK
jgi:hypothetical protein